MQRMFDVCDGIRLQSAGEKFENLYSPQMVERTKTNNNNLKKKLHEKNAIVI